MNRHILGAFIFSLFTLKQLDYFTQQKHNGFQAFVFSPTESMLEPAGWKTSTPVSNLF